MLCLLPHSNESTTNITTKDPIDDFIDDSNEKVIFQGSTREFLVKMTLDEYKAYSAKASKDHLNRLKFDAKSGNFIITMSFEEYGKYDKTRR